jgi:hypothetical protein
MMADKKFTGFRLFYESHRFSNMGRTLMHSLNVDLTDTGGKVGSLPVVPGVMKLQVKEQPPWEDQWEEGTIKWYEILSIGEKSAKIREVTGRCNNKGGNTQNIMAQCSPTSGQEMTITGQQLDWLMAHIAGQGAGGGMGGGGMGGGMPPMPGGGAPPPPGGGGAAPPPPV